MSGIVCHCGITRGTEAATLKYGDSWQKTAGPGCAPIAGGGEADVGAASAEDTAHLESTYYRGTEGKCIGLNFGGMLTAGIGKCIRAQFCKRNLRRRRRGRGCLHEMLSRAAGQSERQNNRQDGGR